MQSASSLLIGVAASMCAGGGDVASPTPAARGGAAMFARTVQARKNRWSLRCAERSIWPAPPCRWAWKHRPWIDVPCQTVRDVLEDRHVGCPAHPARPARHDSGASQPVGACSRAPSSSRCGSTGEDESHHATTQGQATRHDRSRYGPCLVPKSEKFSVL